MTNLTHKSERKECEKELKLMPGRWRVAYKNDRYEFRLSVLRDPVPEHEARRVGDLRGEGGREWREVPERPSVVCSEESERRIVPVARCCGSSGDSSEPFPGWLLIGEGPYVIAGGPPFLLAKEQSKFQDEVVFGVGAEFPTFDAAVMYAELEGGNDGDLR